MIFAWTVFPKQSILCCVAGFEFFYIFVHTSNDIKYHFKLHDTIITMIRIEIRGEKIMQNKKTVTIFELKKFGDNHGAERDFESRKISPYHKEENIFIANKSPADHRASIFADSKIQ